MATLTLTATPELGSLPPRVRLDVTDSGTPAITSVTIYRLDADGRTRLVRTSDSGPLPVSGGPATVYDYEIPFGTEVRYGISEGNAPTVTTQLDVNTPWLVHIGSPSLSVPLTISEFREETRQIEQGTFPILGRRDPIVVTGSARSAPSSALAVLTKTIPEKNALDLLLDDGSALLLNISAARGWGIETCYVSIGNVSRARKVRYAGDLWREWVLPYQEVGRPAGGTQAAVTWDDVDAAYSTWADVATAVSSWAELAAPTS